MSLQTEKNRLDQAKQDIKNAIIEKGGTVSSSAKISDFPAAIKAIKFQTFYTGTSIPSNSLGIDGDLYYQKV